MTRLRYRRGTGRAVAEAVAAANTRLDLDGTAGAWWDTPDDTHFDMLSTDDQEIQFLAALDWSGEGSHKYIGGQVGAWLIQLRTTGAIRYLPTGLQTPISSAIGEDDGTLLWIKITTDVDDGAGNNVVTFYKNTDITRVASWTQISTHSAAGTGGFAARSDEIQIGAANSTTPVIGKLHKFEYRKGIGGAVVFEADFTSRTAGATSIVDAVSGATITQNASGAVIEEY